MKQRFFGKPDFNLIKLKFCFIQCYLKYKCMACYQIKYTPKFKNAKRYKRLNCSQNFQKV